MNTRQVQRIISSREVTEGAGVTVHRSIGTPSLRNLDPFLMLDHFGSDEPDQYIAGFPDHPHRGFITFTYMLDGHMMHQDSMGNKGDLRSGGAQWMKAASGVIHSEMPQQTEGLMRGFQLWINLPAKDKMTAPAYQEYSPEAIPVVKNNGEQVKVLLGEYAGVAGPIQDPVTQVKYYDVEINPGHVFSHHIANGLTAFIYLFEGSVQIGGKIIPTHSFVVLDDGDSVEVVSGKENSRFILVAGQPIGEPILQYGPFVMNTQAEIDQALTDYREGKLVKERATMVGG